MIIKQLRINNFRQFKGNTTVNFSCDKEKNVTVILGDNTFGKTTLLQAFNWCFYKNAVLPNKEMLLNYDVAMEMPDASEVFVEVEIVLIHGGREQSILRKQKYKKYSNRITYDEPTLSISYKTADGQTEIIPASVHKQSLIEKILPENLSGYFFFDTERVGTISESRDLTDAVKGLLGLKSLAEAKKHLGNRQAKTTVIGGFYASMDVGGDQRAELALKNINDARANIDAYNEQIENCDKEISIYAARREKLTQTLRDSQETADLQKQREKLMRYINEENKIIADAKEELIDIFGNGEKKNYGALKFFVRPLLNQALEYLKAAKVDDKGIIDLKAPTLYALLERGVCVCGQELKEGTDAYNHILEEIKYVPPEHIGTTIKNYKNKLNNFSASSEKYFDYIKNNFKRIKASANRVSDWEENINIINAKIQGKENMQSYEFELQDVKRRINEFTSKKNSCLTRIGAEKNKIEQNQKVYDKLIAATGKNASLRKYIAYAEALESWFDELYKGQENETKSKLENKVKEIFKSMYHGERTVEINDKYQVTLLAKVGNTFKATGESEGLNRVKNFAFIAGLVSLAKERVYKRLGTSEIALYEEPYPLVMDAPFSNADEHHTASISKALPDIAEQIIMFVMKKDWYYAEPVINAKVGKKFVLDKQSEQHTILREV